MENNILKHTEDDLFGMYGILGEMFAINYTCLRISNQDIPLSGAGVYGREDIFGSGSKLKQKWIELKLEDAAECRNETFSDLFRAWEENKKNLFADIDIASVLRMRKKDLIAKYNDYYGTNNSFEDAFDGFSSKNPKFNEIIKNFEKSAVYYAEDEKLNFLLHEYHCYKEILKIYMAFSAFDKISTVLEQDLTQSGRPSFYFKRPSVSDVEIISQDEIEHHIETAEKAIAETEAELKREGKKLIPLYKRTRKNMQDYSAHDEISKIKSVIFNLNEKLKKSQEYDAFAKLLMERLAYANTDYDNSKLSDIYEGFFDLTAGINIFKKDSKLKLDWVYAHSLEKNYLSFFEGLFKSSSSLDNEKTEQQRI